MGNWGCEYRGMGSRGVGIRRLEEAAQALSGSEYISIGAIRSLVSKKVRNDYVAKWFIVPIKHCI